LGTPLTMICKMHFQQAALLEECFLLIFPGGKLPLQSCYGASIWEQFLSHGVSERSVQ
jgi:hypothetical protein